MLRTLADPITEAVRSYDAACQWGGEEFVVLLPEVTTVELCSIAERIRRQVRALVVTVDDTPDAVADLSISIGGALYPSPAITDLTELQVAADTALYQGSAPAATASTSPASTPPHLCETSSSISVDKAADLGTEMYTSRDSGQFVALKISVNRRLPRLSGWPVARTVSWCADAG